MPRLLRATPCRPARGYLRRAHDPEMKEVLFS